MNSKCGVQSKRKEKAKSLAFVLLDFQHAKTNASHHDLSEHKLELELELELELLNIVSSVTLVMIWSLISSDVGLTY